MKLSIIIPVYKVEKFVEKCLRSCVEQDIPSDEYEIIVVNDGSPDKSLEIVEKIANEYNNIHAVSQKNQGLSLARNKGLSLAKGDYIWFVDSDDWIEKNILNKLITHCIKSDLDILRFCAANVINGKIVRRFNYESIEKKIINGKDFLLKIGNFHAPFSIYRREFLLENHLLFYPKVLFEDLEFTPRAWYLAQRVMLINDICYYYFINSNSIVYTNNPKKSFDFIEICESLDKFSETVENNYKVYFHNRISDGIVRSLDNSGVMDSMQIKELNSSWKKHSYLFDHLKMSNKWRYKWRYYLFQIFPYYCQVNMFFYYPHRMLIYLTQPKQFLDFLKRQKSRTIAHYNKNNTHPKR
jgi:glycosyltransferase involved in cell wall biosynthesis